jgi:hypothetical protein
VEEVAAVNAIASQYVKMREVTGILQEEMEFLEQKIFEVEDTNT